MKIVLAIIAVPAAIISYFIIKTMIRRSRKNKLRDSYIKLPAEMVNYVHPTTGVGSYFLKMLYVHPKDNKKRYCLTEPIMRDVLSKGDVSFEYEYEMYVHPDDPKCYYVDISKYVKDYPTFEEWIKR
ncbi:MAG: hypothetical protein IKM61_00915 [Eubacteriaceae bacterium]|nr:hypothetical protein [Eubacteriaceae bacterium]